MAEPSPHAPLTRSLMSLGFVSFGSQPLACVWTRASMGQSLQTLRYAGAPFASHPA